MKPETEITMEFANLLGDVVSIVKITGDNEAAWIIIQQEDDTEKEERSIMLDPQEIDVFISALILFKHRILNPKRRKEE
jgi:hypothetical protein